MPAVETVNRISQNGSGSAADILEQATYRQYAPIPIRHGKVAIVGKAPSSRMDAPFDDPEWEIWSLADMFLLIPRFDRWFEIHELHAGKERWSPRHFDWLKKATCPLYVSSPHPHLPNAIMYPKDAVVARFGGYFNNTISWMIALAIMDGAKELALYGVDMCTQDESGNGEYSHQRPSCEYMLGFARGLGISVFIPPASDLLKCRRLYGFDHARGDLYEKMLAREKELLTKIQQIHGEKDQLEKRLDALAEQSAIFRGALDNTKYCKTWA